MACHKINSDFCLPSNVFSVQLEIAPIHEISIIKDMRDTLAPLDNS